MNTLTRYFKGASPAAKQVEPPAQMMEIPAPRVPPSRPGSSRPGSRRFTMHSNASFRDPEDLKSMKADVMTEWLYKQQRLKLWASSAPEEGVILKRNRGEYTCCPEDLCEVRGGLFDQIVHMNVRCAMTISTNVISIFVSSQPGDFASLQGGLSVQILPSIAHLSSALKHQFAAFIRDRQMLVVWDDEPEKIIERAYQLESLLMATIWNNGANYVDEEKNVTVELVNQAANELDLDNLEAADPAQPRRLVLLSPFVVAGTLILLFGALGLGWRKLVIELMIDGGFIRFALLLTTPLLLFCGLFMMQAIMGGLIQIFGPVNQIMENSKAYSGRPPQRIVGGPFPHVTIQMPVYKEGLNAVIRPTVMSVKAAISTYELQGGTASIFVNDDGMQLLSEEDAAKRRDFYDEHGIGWVARPGHYTESKRSEPDFDESKLFTRKGKFKKASNMNYALMVSNKVEDKLAEVPRHAAWTKDLEREAYERCLSEVLSDLNGRAWAGGNIRMGDYILIIDSDTRVPADCLLDAASEMEQSPEVAIIQFSSGVMRVTPGYFESGITFFTNLVYTQIRFAVASGDVCPFVGHNAILRWSALQQVTYEDEDGYEKFWSESHVSEDFDMALRLQCMGYLLRMAAYQGDGFKEGVSLTVYDELARWEKYAYGCNELLFHPFRAWIFKGPFTPLFRKFIASNMPIGAKLTIMAYIGTYYAIGASWLITVMNYFLIGWFVGYLDQFYLDSFAIYVSVIVVFTALGNVGLAVLRYRSNEKGLFSALIENLTWVPLLTIFLGGVSLHISQALLSHLFEIDMSWGSTAKEVEDTSFFEEMPKLLKRFRFTFIFCFLMIGLMVAGSFFFPVFWRINTLQAIYPLASVVLCHLMLPIALNPALMMFTY